MPNTHETLNALFSDIADSIRAKTGSSNSIIADDFSTEIDNIPTGTDTSDATASADDILSGKTAYGATGKLTGNIATKTSTDLEASGNTVTAPAGYYATAASKAIASGSATTPATTITVTPSISVNSSTGLITASNSGSKSITPTVSAGYVASGTAGTVTVDGSNTSQLTVQAATTYNTSSSDQTIAAGKYLTGTQTIKAVSTTNLSAANIKNGVTIKVGDANDDDRISSVTGTFTSTVSSGQTKAAAGQILSGYSGYVDGAEVKGSISSKAAATYNTSTSDQTIAAGQYLSGAQTIRKVTTANISAANIKKGVTITVGDADSATRIANVTGTFSGSTTISSGQTAATAATIRSGYSAFLDGAELKGTLANSTLPTAATSSATSGYTSKATIGRSTSAQYINIPPGVVTAGGYYTVSAVANGSATTPATTISSAPSITISSAGLITASNSKTQSVTPTVSAGYVSSGTAGTITVSGSNTKQMTVKAAATITPGTSNQTIAAGTYLTGAQTIAGSSNLVAGNIKSGVNIFGVTGTLVTGNTTVSGTWGKNASYTTGKVSSTITPVYGATLASNSSYALIAGGYASGYINNLYSLNSALALQAQTAFPNKIFGGVGGTLGSYAIIGKGRYDSHSGYTYENTSLYAYNTSLTRTTCSTSSSADPIGLGCGCGNVGSYLVIVGGLWMDSDTEDAWDVTKNAAVAYNTSLTRSAPSAPTASYGMYHCGSASIGSYVIYAGGKYVRPGAASTNSATVAAYNTSLTKSTPTAVSTGGFSIGGANSSYAIIFCGNTTASVYNTSLTKSTLVCQTGSPSTEQTASTSSNVILFKTGYIYTYSTSLTATTLSSAFTNAFSKGSAYGATVFNNKAIAQTNNNTIEYLNLAETVTMALSSPSTISGTAGSFSGSLTFT